MELCFHHPEFEQEVRSRLKIFDRSITGQDIKKVTELDLSNFYFLDEDREVLCLCHSLISLDICIGNTDSGFWDHFPKLQFLCVICMGDEFDFKIIHNLKNLESLIVSGGDLSDIPYKNPDALLALKKLEGIELHEFGAIDLAPLSRMQQLKFFALRYADEIANIDMIGTMNFLDTLVLDGLDIESLDFLDTLPSRINLKMCGNHVRGGVDIHKWKRFASRDICEISVGDSRWNYISLAALEE